MSNPEVLRSILSMQGGGMPTGGMSQPGMNPFMNPLMNPMNPINNPAMQSQFQQQPQQPAQQPEVLYATQLQQLQDMGFFNASENIRALQLCGGNVEAAVEYLFSKPPGM